MGREAGVFGDFVAYIEESGSRLEIEREQNCPPPHSFATMRSDTCVNTDLGQCA